MEPSEIGLPLPSKMAGLLPHFGVHGSSQSVIGWIKQGLRGLYARVGMPSLLVNPKGLPALPLHDAPPAVIGDAAVPADVVARAAHDPGSVAAYLEHTNSLSDLDALDLVQIAFPRSTRRSHHAAGLAIARVATQPFGTENRLPLTALYAWSMLDHVQFGDAFAAQFSAISAFVLNWQTDERDFLVLDPSEIALIELLFEGLHPRKHGLLAAKVMDFKVLSNRRMGLVRRFPTRVERMLDAATSPESTEAAIGYAKDCLALLDHMARPEGFTPIIEEAKLAAAKIVKAIQKTMASQPPVLPALPAPAAPTQVTVAPPKRLTKRHRTEAALRYLRGEAVTDIARSLGVKAAAIEGWAEAFLAGGASALAAKDKANANAPTQAPTEMEDLKARVEELTRLVDTLSQDSNRPG